MTTQAAVDRPRTRKVTDAERSEILDLIREGLPRNEIMRRTGRSASVVSGIASAAGLTFDRTQIQAAATARQADVQDRLSKLAEDLVADAERLRRQLWEPCLVYSFGGKENVYAEHTIDEPDFRAKQAILTSVGIAVDKVVAIRKAEAGPGEATGLIVDLVNAIRGEP